MPHDINHMTGFLEQSLTGVNRQGRSRRLFSSELNLRTINGRFNSIVSPIFNKHQVNSDVTVAENTLKVMLGVFRWYKRV